MDFIKVTFNRKTAFLHSPVNVEELIKMFNVQREGIHFKIRIRDGYENLWPDMDLFCFPPGVTEAFLIGMPINNSEHSDNVSTSTELNNMSVAWSPGFAKQISSHRRGNSAACGSRSVPSMKRKVHATHTIPVPLKKKKESCGIFKMISVSDITDDEVETIYEVPIDLSKLGAVNVRTIQEEVRNQVGGTSYILTNKKGNPIRDMPNTRGVESWNNKSIVRAIDCNAFKNWKPNMYKLIKGDYALYSSDGSGSDDESLRDFLDTFTLPTPPPFDYLMTSTTTTSHSMIPFTTSTSTSTSSVTTTNTELKSMLETIQNDLRRIVNSRNSNNGEEVDSGEVEALRPGTPEMRTPGILVRIKECLKCPVCLDLKFPFVCCTRCSRMVGCADCIHNNVVTRCPLCRNEFNQVCPKCNDSFFRSPPAVTIAGLEDILFPNIDDL